MLDDLNEEGGMGWGQSDVVRTCLYIKKHRDSPSLFSSEPFQESRGLPDLHWHPSILKVCNMYKTMVARQTDIKVINGYR